MSQRSLTPGEIECLQEALSADYEIVDIRLREGEHQHTLAKTIASFQLKLDFPDVKDIITRLYGEEKAGDIQLVRKIQTILKKMERSNVVKILPKKKPWELQRYALPSFKFEDNDKNLVILATDQQMKQTKNLLQPILSKQKKPLTTKRIHIDTKILTLVLAIVASYIVILWDLIQPSTNLIIFIPAFSLAVACSLMLGKALSQK